MEILNVIFDYFFVGFKYTGMFFGFLFGIIAAFALTAVVRVLFDRILLFLQKYLEDNE